MIDKNFPPYVKDIGNGVLYILVNTEERWVDYQLNKMVPDEGKFQIVFFGDDDDKWDIEEFEVFQGFKIFDYIITSSQEKDQITIICVPRDLILDKN